MHFDDYGPPHFHALYGGDEALVEIEALESDLRSGEGQSAYLAHTVIRVL